MSERPPEEVLSEILRGAMATKALGLVVDLGLPEALADGPRPVAELAGAAGADADTLHRLLRALASVGVFAEEAHGVFGHTRASELLRRGGWGEFAHLFGGVWYATIGSLGAATGDAAFPRTFGTDFWTWLGDHPAERATFDRAMTNGNDLRADRLASVDWRGDETVVDVGGGNGSLIVELLRRRPGLRGIVFDLPETVRDETAFGDGVEFVAGSFFDGVPSGDVYVLSTILHDWDDASAAAILRTIHAAAAPAGARLVVLERVISPGNEPDPGKWLDLLVLALFNGRERTESDWRALLAATAFEPTRIENGLIEARCR